MHHVRELDGVTNKESWEVIADQVPVTVSGVELGGKTARVTQGFRGVVAVNDGRESHKYRGGFASGENFGLGQVAQVISHRKRAVGAGAPGVHHALGNAFAVEALQLLNELHVLQQHRAIGAGGLRILVVTDGRAVISRQVGGLHRKRKQTGSRQQQRMSRQHWTAAHWVVHRGFLWFF